MQVLPAAHPSTGMPSPTLTNPDMILPDNVLPDEDTTSLNHNLSNTPGHMIEEERHARAATVEHQLRSKQAKQSLSPFRNGVLAQNDGPPRLRSNSERGHGRIQFNNSRLSFRPNGEERATPSPHLHEDTNGIGLERLSESPEEEDGPSYNTYTAPSILDEDEDDPESHAAMTRRAEEILANAKKRLTNMEGNLNRARSTIGSRPSSSMSSFADRDAPLLRERRANGDYSRSKHRQVNLTLKEDHQGHSRVFSETAVPSSLQSPTKAHAEGANGESSTDPARPWFWNGLHRSTSLADRHRRGLQPLEEDGPALNSFERQAILEEEEEDSQKLSPGLQNSAAADADARASPTQNLARSRSTNHMRDLRDQVSDLKGKISTLKQRAREDSLKRRSLQSLRTPSPLNNAEQDYSQIPLAEVQIRGSGLDGGDELRQNRTPPKPAVTEDIQPGTTPPADDEMNAQQMQRSPAKDSGIGLPDQADFAEINNVAQPDIKEIVTNDQAEDLQLQHEGHGLSKDEVEITNATPYPDASQDVPIPEPVSEPTDTTEFYDSEETDTFDEPVGERHEDRADAFDYEHFFLHSSMGHYARKRSSTHSSNYSTETERPPTMVHDGSVAERDDSPGKHARAGSSSSISTMATFATATEGEGTEEEDEEEEWTPRQTMAGTWLVDPPVIETDGNNKASKARARRNPDSKHEKYAKRHRREHSVTDVGVNEPIPSVPDIMTYLAAFAPKAEGQPAELNLADSDKALVERVIRSLAKVSRDLHDFGAEGGKYEARVCRRKLDTARRHLDGEVNGEAF